MAVAVAVVACALLRRVDEVDLAEVDSAIGVCLVTGVLTLMLCVIVLVPSTARL